MNTYGWDLVAAYKVERVNANLAAHMQQTPVTVSYSDNNIAIEATFGVWTIVAGGSNKLLRFEMPVSEGTLTAQGAPFDLAGVVAVIELQLAFIDNASVGNVRDLHFNLEVAGQKAGDTTAGAVTLVSVTAPDSLDKAAQQAFGDNLVACMLANRDKLAYVFASVNVGPAEPDQRRAGGIYLDRCSYSYLQGEGDAPGHLVILCLLDYPALHRDAKTHPRADEMPVSVDPALVDNENDLCCAFSKEVLLEYFVGNRLEKLYHKLRMEPNRSARVRPAGRYIMKGSRIEIGKRDSMAFEVQPANNSDRDYVPYIDVITIDIEDSTLVFTMNGRVWVTPGGDRSAYPFPEFHLILALTSRHPIRFDKETNSLALEPDPEPEMTVEPNQPFPPTTADMILDIFTLGTAELFRAVFLPPRGEEAAMDAGRALNDLGEITLAISAAGAISWGGADTNDWDIIEVGVADGLYFRKNPRKEYHEPPKPRLGPPSTLRKPWERPGSHPPPIDPNV